MGTDKTELDLDDRRYVRSGTRGLSMSIKGCLVALAAIITGCTTRSPDSHAQPPSPLSSFQGLSTSALQTIQIKIVYTPDSPRTPLLIAADTSSARYGAFNGHRRHDVSYSNEVVAPIKLLISPAEAQQLIDSLATVASAADSGMHDGGYVSLAIMRALPDTAVFETVINQSSGSQVFGKWRPVLLSNSPAQAALRETGSQLSFYVGPVPEDAPSSMVATLGGFRRVRGGSIYVGTLRVQNLGSATSEKIRVVLQTAEGVQVISPSGATARVSPAGYPYIDLRGSGSFGSRQVRTIEVEIDNKRPVRTPIRMVKAIVGSGDP